MFYRLKTAIGRSRFDHAARGVLSTAPLTMRDAPLTIVSMLRSGDVLAWLVAIKSAYPRLGGRGRVVIVDDGSLTADDMETIRSHVPLLTIRPLADGQIEGLPTGGAWERLCVIADEATRAFTVQLDADIVVSGPLEHVTALIEAGRPFALADGPSPGLASLPEVAAWVRAQPEPLVHVQDYAEAALANAALPRGARYLRGTAAFAGFPAGHDILPGLRQLHGEMKRLLGPRWDEWGAEQVASNYALGNAGGAVALTPPAYANHTPETDIGSARLVHFYGTHRFKGGRYASAARRAVAAMEPSARR